MSTRMSRAVLVALGVSVALNCVAVGFFIARAMQHRSDVRQERRAGAGPFMGPHGLLADLGDPSVRAQTKAVMKRHARELRREHGELRVARRAVRDALLAEPFDPGALEQALAGLRARTDGSQLRMHAALVELAKELDPAARRELARKAHVLEGGALRPPGPHGPFRSPPTLDPDGG